VKTSRWVVPALILAYAGAAALYGWQAWSQATPWIFPDETLHARAAQSIAGASSGSIGSVSGVLYSAVISPAWLFHDPVTSYDVAKLIGALVMSTVVVPAYLLARLFTGRVPAVVAAVASVAIPGMFYSSLLMQESVAYPYSTLVLYVLASGIATGSRRRLAVAFVLGLVGPLIRPELVVLPIVIVLAVLVWIWFGEWATRRRARWTASQWLTSAGVFLLVVAAAGALGAAVSVGWRTAVQNPDDLFRYAALALGPLAAGVAILPVLAGPAVLTRRDAFMPVFAAAATAYVVYVAAKEAFLASRPAIYGLNDLLGERNLIYLSPVFFAATAIWMERRRVNRWALAGAAAVLVAIFAWIPYVFDQESAPHSPTVVSISDIVGGLSQPAVRAGLIVATLAAGGLLLLRGSAVLAVVAVVIIGWSLTGEVNAGNRSLDIGRALVATQPRPLDWIDRATRGGTAVYVGQAKLRAPEILSLAFWNESLTRLVTLGGEPVYGLIFETKIRPSNDGRLTDPERADYVVSDQEVEVAGQRMLSRKRWRLQRVAGPVRVVAYEQGIWQDGWQEQTSSYTRFSSRHAQAWVRVGLSQQAGCVPSQSPRFEISVTDLRIREVVSDREGPLQVCGSTAARVPVPPPPFRVRVHIEPTFVPAEVMPGSADTRHLGAMVTYRYGP
jgi:MFS family permease